jgi:protein-L-isoaspartate(D-aspartate) O-methyltransferase
VNAEALVAELRGAVADERVLAAIGAVPRAAFVPARLRGRAWENAPLPIGRGQTISQPLVVALMCEALRLRAGDRVLDVGTGSGYHAAILVTLGARVWSIERHRPLADRARRALEKAGIEGVEVVVGDGREGYPPAAPYDAISVAATADGELPQPLLDQLALGGRLVAPLRDRTSERLVLVRRTRRGLRQTNLGLVRFVPLLEGVEG